MTGVFWKVTLEAFGGEALVQGGKEQEGPHGSFAGESSAAHLHPVHRLNPTS